MQNLQPLLRLAMVVEISSSRNGCLSSSQKRSLPPFAQPSPNLASRHASHRSWAPSHQRRLRLPNKPLHLCCSHPYAPRNVGQPCNASSSLALRARGKAASQFIPRCAMAQRIHHSQRSGGCERRASWPIKFGAPCNASTSSVQSGHVIACQRRECAA